MTGKPERPASNDDREAWTKYWAKVQPQAWFDAWGYWRTEPEIDAERQQYLATRRGVSQNVEEGIYPFRDGTGSIRLTRADVEWLLATHNRDRGPVDWTDIHQRHLWGPDLHGADLTGVDLTHLPLTQVRAGLTRAGWFGATHPQREAARVHLEGSILVEAHLERAALRDAQLTAADLRGARMERATLHCAHLSQAVLRWAHLEAANLEAAIMEGVDLRLAYVDPSTHLRKATLVSPFLAGIHWGGLDLSFIDWSQASRMGDEVAARKRRDAKQRPKSKGTKLGDMEAAVRAHRQVATALRSQGLNEYADRYAYRAQLCQRVVLRRQHHYLRWIGSAFLWLIAGYGYKPLRSFLTYLLVVLIFATAYFLLRDNVHPALSPVDAVIFSITSIHGRGFSPGESVTLHNPLTIFAAVEAIIGLLIEITFIATFTQRFFAR